MLCEGELYRKGSSGALGGSAVVSRVVAGYEFMVCPDSAEICSNNGGRENSKMTYAWERCMPPLRAQTW